MSRTQAGLQLHRLFIRIRQHCSCQLRSLLPRLLPNVSLAKHLIGLETSIDEVQLASQFLESASLVTDGCVAIDIGFHRGLSSRHLLQAFDKVLAFEPLRSTAEKADSSILNNPKLDLRYKAISDSVGKDYIYVSPASDGISSLQQSLSMQQNPILIQTTTLAAEFNTAPLYLHESVQLIKIDVEGLESMVLSQISHIPLLRPLLIISEFQDAKSHYGDLQSQLTTLISMGYFVVLSVWKPVRRYGISHDWHSFIPVEPCNTSIYSSLLFSHWGNIIAIKKDYSLSFLSFLSSSQISRATSV